ncbi:hypothetical protein Asulf_00967 [Archaeoglobus sulfaticallidus PM70-1]|uniref:Uncharacterized protein n=1 Tax=Archaeoglobus sulfaticallidus PM70-1 TaxID=387631 RepID=N0BKE8_9EURY|nr:hypothetical protein Asulf_00967 [Archaeoglobus sulfaticallidus PM70-1]
MLKMRAENRPVERLIEEIERKRCIMLIEVVQLAEELTDNRGNAFELTNRAISKLAKRRRVEIGFRY